MENVLASEQELIDQVARLIAELQDAVQLLDESAAAQLGLNLTDLRCVRQVIQDGPRSASQLADATGLTRAAISAALDRLERANVARRVQDSTDRRRTLVEPTDGARRHVARIWAPIENEGRRELAGYSNAELQVIVDFLAKTIDLHHEHTRRLQQSKAST